MAKNTADQWLNATLHAGIVPDSNTYFNMIQQDWQNEKTEKNMRKGAVLGGIVAGPGGAVVGALIGKEKSKNKW